MDATLVPAALLAAAAYVLLRPIPRSARVWTRLAAPAVAIVATATFAAVRAARQDEVRAARTVAAAVPKRRPAPFVASAACKPCHPHEYETWHRSYHRTMTQAVAPGARLAPLEDIEVIVRGTPVRIFREGGLLVADMPDPEWVERVSRIGTAPVSFAGAPRTRRPVVMATGSHWMQTYWVPGRREGELRNVPVVWVDAFGRFLPREEVFLRPPDAGPFHQTWNDNCIICHATAARPRPTPRRTWATDAVELGIACEACHGPGEEHVARFVNPFLRYAVRLGAAVDPGIEDPRELPPRRADAVCAQCHAKTWIDDFRKFLREGFSFRPGDPIDKDRTLVRPASEPDHPWLRISLEQDPSFVRSFFWPDGTIRVSGRQYNGMELSACRTRGDLSCLSCHTMHGDEPNLQIRPGMAGDGACTGCHPDVAAEGPAHTHHSPGRPGSACMDCHMPYTTFGLLRGLRSHRIDSPQVAPGLRAARPDACTLCHLDRPRAWVRSALADTFGVPQPPPDPRDRERDETVAAGLRLLYEGDAVQRAVVAFAMGRPGAHAAAGTSWIAGHLAVLLDDPYAAVRLVALASLGVLPGYEDLASAPPVTGQGWANLRIEVDRRFSDRASPIPPGRSGVLLLQAPGRVDAHARTALLADRDRTPIELKE